MSGLSYLDSYRGLLCIPVIIQQTHLYNSDMNFKLDGKHTISHVSIYFFGVINVFILSAFLLTARLLKKLSNSNSVKNSIKILILYSIQRFLGIYVPFFILVTLIKVHKVFGGIYEYTPWFDMISLNHTGSNHLWFIAPEIKYSFFIPVVCLLVLLFGKIWYLFTILSCFSLFYVYYFNLLQLKKEDFLRKDGITNSLLPRFVVFYAGSVFAIFYFKCKKFSLFESTKIGFICGILSSIILIYMFKSFNDFSHIGANYYYSTFKRGLCWSTLLVLILLGSPNFFTNFLMESKLLKSFGNLSFGIYLLYPVALKLMSDWMKFHTLVAMKVLVAILLSYLFGFIFYYSIEWPLIKLGSFLEDYFNGNFTMSK